MANNEIRNIRPGSRFSTYKPQTESQQNALEQFQTLAKGLIEIAPAFNGASNPIGNASMYVMAGRPGTGKTHLMEAVVNEVAEKAPALLDRIFYLRYDFTLATITGVSDYTFDKKPIILIDDLFAKHQSVAKLHPSTDIKGMMDFISYIYENRNLVVATTNFPFIDQILPRIAQVDTVGRTLSRCKEIITAHSGEIVIDGPDYREILAEEALAARRANKFPALIPGGNG